ncbi:MAG: hypothetical protein DMG77_06635 [Acidobacteria bacterium]|nr:MAG: hypothetical protein DMG77_06635 [Acidobacteriota bacterium]
MVESLIGYEGLLTQRWRGREPAPFSGSLKLASSLEPLPEFLQPRNYFGVLLGEESDNGQNLRRAYHRHHFGT